MQRKWALVTGASSGIGEATAERLAHRQYGLVLVARREAQLLRVKDRLQSQYRVPVKILAVDIGDREKCLSALAELCDLAEQIEVLVNNAGLALGVDRLQEANMDDWEAMINTNVMGLLYVSRWWLPFRIPQGSGHIVNLGSVAGRWVYPGGSVYCASKFAVRALSEGLRMDLLGKGIRVTNIEPGMVETEFSMVRLRDEAKASDVYRDMTPLSARDVAEAIIWSLERPAHVNIQELVIYPTDQAAVGQVHRGAKEARS